MSDRQYARIRAWHVIREWRGAAWFFLCGRDVPDSTPTVDALPWNEPSCESCLRIVRRQDDPGRGEDDASTHTELVP